MTSERPSPARAASAADLSDFGYDAQLRRSLNLGDLLVYGLVFISPIAPFAIFGIVFNASKGLVPLTYVIGLVAMLFTALSYREMSAAFPIAGSVYAYAVALLASLAHARRAASVQPTVAMRSI